MAVIDKLETWLTHTPKRLVAALFALAATAICVVVVVLLVLAPQIAALPNKQALNDVHNDVRNPKTATGLVALTGKTFRTDSTLKLETTEVEPTATLNLSGLETLTYPKSLTRVEQDSTNVSQGKYGSAKTAQPLPTVRNINAGDPVNLGGIQAFWQSLKSGSTTTMAQNCWTITPEVFTDRYTTVSARQTLLEALTNTPQVDQQGVTWASHAASVTATWTELSATFTCPVVQYGEEPDMVTTEDINYLIDRLVARSSYPLNGADTEANYPTLCEKWEPPVQLSRFYPQAKTKLRYDSQNRLAEADLQQLKKLRSKAIKLYTTPVADYPLYLQASHDGLEKPAAFFYSQAPGHLCLGSLVGDED